LARPVTFSTPSGRMGRVPTTFRVVSNVIKIRPSSYLPRYRQIDRNIQIYIYRQPVPMLCSHSRAKRRGMSRPASILNFQLGRLRFKM
jgi:hypothetical protein